MTEFLHLPEQIRRPRVEQLKQFALVLPLATGAICWGASANWTATLVAIAISLVASISGWFYPGIVRPLFVALSVLAFPIGALAGELIMLTIYFGLITPIGLFFRMRRRDWLERTIDRSRASYWHRKPQPKNPASYLRRW